MSRSPTVFLGVGLMRAIAIRSWLVTAFLLTLPAGEVRADIIFMKDGYALQGKVRREVTAEFDPTSKEMLYIPKGFFSLNDGPRWVYFSPNQVRVVEKMAAPMEERILSRTVRFMALPRKMEPILEVVETKPWDYQKWERGFVFRSPNAPLVGLKQAVASINPQHMRLDAITKFWWSAAYLTREFEPEVIEKMLATYPEFKDKPGDKPSVIVARRMRKCDFYAQASLFPLAERELDQLLKDLPDQKERVASARATVDRLKARDEWEEIKKWHQGGRDKEVAKRLAEFPTRNVPDRILLDVRELQGRLKATLDTVEQAGTALDEQVRAAKTATGKSLASAAGQIRKELHPATVGRLDAFLGQVKEAGRRKARGKPAQMTTEQLLSLAISGWLLGSSSAEARPEAALNLWKTRQMVLEYQQESDPTARKKILADYEARITPRVEIDEVAQLIDSLPPAVPAPVAQTRITEETIGKGRAAKTYALALPPEYTHDRQYPVLIVLADHKQKARAMLEQWEKHAADNGYILASPEWNNGLGGEYGYSVEEHDAVLDTLRDLRRRFQIDSDRVFLFGMGEGGKMAFDVGLSHPDQFAGVLPMSAGPSMFPRRYWRNAQYLPFYVVNGTRAGDTSTLIRTQFENWVLRGFPCLWMEYKGRGIEFFKGELPAMFDWMRHQKRAFPMRQLGTDGGGGPTGTEFCTMRDEDNRFYWLGMSKVATRHLAIAERWNNNALPGYATANINPTTNEVTIKSQGVGEFTLWFGRNSAGQYMIDLEKPVSVMVGFKNVVARRKIAPSLTVMLEELYRTGDRKHLFVGKLVFSAR
jgi:pimeloyl-ACP methyl ester carboxylesterase